MDWPTAAVLKRMPLAEGVLLMWRWVASETRLQKIWDGFRGSCFQRQVTFAMIVRLIADALLQYAGSLRRSYAKYHEEQELSFSVQAAYKKLSHLPIAVSQAFLRECTQALWEIFPQAGQRQLPKSLRKFRPCIIDGKALKRIAKRLKALRGRTAGMLGGRALVAMDWLTGLAVCMQADADGYNNEVRHMGDMVPQVCACIQGRRLFVGDRAFCDLVQTARFTEAKGDHFLVRYHPKVPFYPDRTWRKRRGTDERGRKFTEKCGWLGKPENPNRRYVRRIMLERPNQDPIILVTDLVDADQYPAVDLLWLYAERVGIEYLFQQVTEVFGLKGLISSSPEGGIFQFAYCMTLYNMIQVVRAYVAEGQERAVDTISAEKLFDDVQRELTAWNIMLEVKTTVDYLQDEPTLGKMKKRLTQLLGPRWSDTWVKAPRQRNRPKSPAKRTRTHGSVFRIVQAYKEAQRKSRRNSP